MLETTINSYKVTEVISTIISDDSFFRRERYTRICVEIEKCDKILLMSYYTLKTNLNSIKNQGWAHRG